MVAAQKRPLRAGVIREAVSPWEERVGVRPPPAAIVYYKDGIFTTGDVYETGEPMGVYTWKAPEPEPAKPLYDDKDTLDAVVLMRGHKTLVILVGVFYDPLYRALLRIGESPQGMVFAVRGRCDDLAFMKKKARENGFTHYVLWDMREH